MTTSESKGRFFFTKRIDSNRFDSGEPWCSAATASAVNSRAPREPIVRRQEKRWSRKPTRAAGAEVHGWCSGTFRMYPYCSVDWVDSYSSCTELQAASITLWYKDKLVLWAQKWQMVFNVDKCKVMRVGNWEDSRTYYMEDRELSVVSCEKDLDIWI